MNFFNATDTADATTYLRSVNQSDGSFSEHILMPITGLENNGQPVIPKCFGDTYDLYLTVDASGKGTAFDSLNVTLWADPKGNDGAPGVSETSDPSFANGTRGDIVLATGTMVSANLNLDSTGTRHADFVETLTPTLAGRILSAGSLTDGTLLEERLTSSPAVLSSIPQANGTTVNLVTGGVAKIDSPAFNAVQYQNNLLSIVQADRAFVSHRIDPVTGFTRNDDAVVPNGFGSRYGVYLDITDTGVSLPTSVTFSSSSFRLMYDPGNQNGAVTSTPAGISFANTGASGVADDIVLGTGTMTSGVASLDPATGVRTTRFVENFTPTPGASGLSPFVGSAAIFNFVNSLPGSLELVTPGPNGTTFHTFNGGSGVVRSVPAIAAGDTIQVADIPSRLLHPGLRFIHHRGPHGHGAC